MNFDNIFKFKTEEENKKDTISLSLPMWNKEETEEEESRTADPVKSEENLKSSTVKPGTIGSAFERIETSRFKGLPKFKPFNERITTDMQEKILKDPTFPQVSKAFADKLAEKITNDSDIKDVLSWLFQTIRIFELNCPPDRLLNEAKDAENLGELLRAKLRYLDLSVLALVEGDSTQLSSLMQRLHEITQKQISRKSSAGIEDLFLKRFSIISNQPREVINLINENYPKYEEELVRYLEHSLIKSKK
ncbi:MAG: hypothetical protein ABIH00_06380 [Armatimonadota bacterium]